MSEQQQIDKGLKHLGGSEEIIGNIVAYCVNAHKADPSPKTLDKIRQYVSDTANSVCGHVLTIAHNINAIIDKETKEIEEMAFQVDYVQHRLRSHQTYMSELYMTKFQTLPRPRPVIHILRETIPTEKLPKYARPKKPWVRQGIFDYSVLDHVGSGKHRKQQSTASPLPGEGMNPASPKNKKVNSVIAPKAAVEAFNPYGNAMNNGNAPQPNKQKSTENSYGGSSPRSLYQQDQFRKQQSAGATPVKSIGAAPPSFSNAPPSFSAAPASFSAASDNKKQPKVPQPPQPPSAAVPPPVPSMAVPPPVPSAMVPPPVPPPAPQD